MDCSFREELIVGNIRELAPIAAFTMYAEDIGFHQLVSHNWGAIRFAPTEVIPTAAR
jgi:hypothetical protein